jgi:hypothetical protein
LTSCSRQLRRAESDSGLSRFTLLRFGDFLAFRQLQSLSLFLHPIGCAGLGHRISRSRDAAYRRGGKEVTDRAPRCASVRISSASPRVFSSEFVACCGTGRMVHLVCGVRAVLRIWLSSTMLRACCWLCAARCAPRTKYGSAVCLPMQLACVSTLHASSCMSSAVCCTSSAVCCLVHSARCLLVAILCAMSVACCTLLAACCTLLGACCTRSVVCCCVRCIMHAAIMHAASSLAHLACCVLRVACRLLCAAHCPLRLSSNVHMLYVHAARCLCCVACRSLLHVVRCIAHAVCMFSAASCTLSRYVLHVVRCMAHVCCMSSVACCRVTQRRRPPC